MTERTSNAFVLEHYQKLIQHSHPAQLQIWPIISGYDCKRGEFQDWWVIIFIHTGNSVVLNTYGIGELPQSLIGSDTINLENKERARSRIEKHFALRPQDGVVFMRADGSLENSELMALMHRHEIALGLAPMRIFLSHKGSNKAWVRQFKTTLALLGFDPWFDKDAMPAGTNLERGILKGFTNSCAAVFFITPEFKDESFLATEVDYAIEEKREKTDKFAIIT